MDLSELEGEQTVKPAPYVRMLLHLLAGMVIPKARLFL